MRLNLWGVYRSAFVKLQSNRVELMRNLNVEAVVAWIVMFFMILFALWTLSHHAATFAGIPWKSLSLGLIMAGLPITLLAAWCARRFSISYAKETKDSGHPTGLQGISLMVLFVMALILFFTHAYNLRFGFALIGFLLTWSLSQKQFAASANASILESDSPHGPNVSSWFLAAFIFIAVIVTLSTHRSNFDDAEYLQMAAQTLRFPDRAPLTFDSSLGFILESFRFAPYRIASYETLVAFITQWTGLDLLTVYYLILPALTSALTIGCAYLFSRWFLPSGAAILATGIFLLIMLAWGESDYAYGNRVFVRLFQGKGILIALTTPMTVIAGFLLLRRPSLWHWVFLALMQVAALGVSSTGLVVTFITTALVLVVAVRRDIKATLFASAAVASTLCYPALIGAWLKFSSNAVISFSQIGTYLPINASLGIDMREALALSGLAIGVGALGVGIQKREYGLLVGATFLIALNPWFSEFLAVHTAKNMTWRLAWAAPIPLLLAVAFAASLIPIRQKKIPIAGPLFALALLGLFLGASRWAVMPANNVNWGWPSAKVPAEYDAARDVFEQIQGMDVQGTVLAEGRLGTWLTVVAPDLKLVMPGHGYIPTLETILPKTEYNERMRLLDAINGSAVSFDGSVELMRRYRVSTLVIPHDMGTENFIRYLYSRPDIGIKEVASVATYRIFVLS